MPNLILHYKRIIRVCKTLLYLKKFRKLHLCSIDQKLFLQNTKLPEKKLSQMKKKRLRRISIWALSQTFIEAKKSFTEHSLKISWPWHL